MPPITTEKIRLFKKLKTEAKAAQTLLANVDPKAEDALRKTFIDWAKQIIKMRLIQEYETIKGLLVIEELVQSMGIAAVEEAMLRGCRINSVRTQSTLLLMSL